MKGFPGFYGLFHVLAGGQTFMCSAAAHFLIEIFVKPEAYTDFILRTCPVAVKILGIGEQMASQSPPSPKIL